MRQGAEDKHLIEDFHFNVVVQLPASRAENGAKGFGYASILANYPADVLWMNSQFEDSHRLPLDRTNLHFFGMVH